MQKQSSKRGERNEMNTKAEVGMVDIERKTIRIATWNGNGYTRAATEEEIRAAEEREWKMRGQ